MGLSFSNLRWVWVAIGAAGLVLALATLDHVRQRQAVAAPIHGDWETDPALWGRQHPREYQTWKLGQESARQEPRSAWSQWDPHEVGLWAGSGAEQDVSAPRAPGHPATCQVCHDPGTLDLRITQPAFLQALSRQGLDPARLSRQDLRTYVCAQCHSASSGDPGAARTEIAFSAERIRAWSEAEAPATWRHPASGTSLLRFRHPEFELWREGIHARRGVSCADCHMPEVSEGSARFTDHHVGSPMRGVYAACLRCHKGGEGPLRARVKGLQDTTTALRQRAVQALQEAHGALARAQAAGQGEAVLKVARARLRQAQLRWDFIVSDGSAGLHAPQEAATILGEAIDLARQAEVEARRRP